MPGGGQPLEIVVGKQRGAGCSKGSEKGGEIDWEGLGIQRERERRREREVGEPGEIGKVGRAWGD